MITAEIHQQFPHYCGSSETDLFHDRIGAELFSNVWGCFLVSDTSSAIVEKKIQFENLWRLKESGWFIPILTSPERHFREFQPPTRVPSMQLLTKVLIRMASILLCSQQLEQGLLSAWSLPTENSMELSLHILQLPLEQPLFFLFHWTRWKVNWIFCKGIHFQDFSFMFLELTLESRLYAQKDWDKCSPHLPMKVWQPQLHNSRWMKFRSLLHQYFLSKAFQTPVSSVSLRRQKLGFRIIVL